uniref:Uncharacterized protein n=1 Tax=Arundo donax TaxID=35708 RepID=A0A0A9HC75_ARUDO
MLLIFKVMPCFTSLFRYSSSSLLCLCSIPMLVFLYPM